MFFAKRCYHHRMLRRVIDCLLVASLLFALAPACSRTPDSSVRLDLGSLYERQGLSIVPRSKVEFSTLLLAVFPTPQDQETKEDETKIVVQKVTPDPSTLTFEAKVNAGDNYQVGLLGGEVDGEGNFTRLDYIGVKGPVSFTADQTTEVSIELRPAALLGFELAFPAAIAQQLAGFNIDTNNLVCSLGLQRTSGEISPLDRSSYYTSTPNSQPSPSSIGRRFGVGFEPLVTGDFTVSGLANCVGFNLEIEPTRFTLAQSERVKKSINVLKIIKTGPTPTGPTGPLNPPQSDQLRVRILKGTDFVNTVSDGDQPRILVEALRPDLSVNVDYTGGFRLRFYSVDNTAHAVPLNVTNDSVLLNKLNFRLASAPGVDVDPGLEVRSLPSVAGAATARIHYGNITDNTRTTFIIVAESPTNPHLQGYVMVNLGGAVAPPCNTASQSATAPGSSMRPVSVIESKGLFLGPQGAPLASHTFVGLLYSEFEDSFSCPATVAPAAGSAIVIASERAFVAASYEQLVVHEHLELIGLSKGLIEGGIEADLVKVPLSTLDPLMQRTFFNAVRAVPNITTLLSAPTSYPRRTYLLPDTVLAGQIDIQAQTYGVSEFTIHVTER